MFAHRAFVKASLVLITAVGVMAATGGSADPIERFTAFAINLDNPGRAATANVDMTVSRWTTDAERDRLLTTLLEQGPDKLLEALRDTPRTGTIRTPDTLAYDLRFARRTPLPEGGERVVFVTDRPIGFWEASRQPRSIDYPFTVIELRLNANGEGEGKLSIATKITADRESGTIVLENYNIQPVLLSTVKRERR
jgi:hypothetical protein